jgi:hypothetical protein
MSTTDNFKIERQHAFLREAELAGIEKRIAAAVFEVFEPWLRKKEVLWLSTKLYEDLGIAEEDLEDTVYECWEKVFGTSLTQQEASAFPKVISVSDLIRHIVEVSKKVISPHD